MTDTGKTMHARVIRASAGTGKTTRIVSEITERLMKGLAPDQLIAVTFTEKAAAELKSRLQQNLVRQGMHEASLRIEGAMIGTVHSVCLRMLMRFAFQAGISPQSRPIPERYAEALFGRAIAGALKDTVSDAVRDAACRMRMSRDISQVAKKIAGEAWVNCIEPAALVGMADESVAEVTGWAGKRRWSCIEDPDAAFVAMLRELCRDCEKAFTEYREKQAGKGKRPADNARQYLSDAKQALRQAESGMLEWGLVEKLATKCPASLKPAVESHLSMLADHRSHPRFINDLTVYTRAAFALAREGMIRYADEKRAACLIDYNDMERYALELLSDGMVAETLSGEFRLLVVDEFQDTSPLQLALFGKLGALAGDMVWVGDRKQAIYAFRGSDPELMDRAYAWVISNSSSEDNQTDVLRTSYRSREKLVGMFNDVFVKHFITRDYTKDELELVAHRKESGESGILNDHFMIWFRDTEAADNDEIVAGIAALLEKSPLIYDRRAGSLRPLERKDIAVLCRKNQTCGEVASSLIRSGIPAYAMRSGLLKTKEGIFVDAALRLMIDRNDVMPRVTIEFLTGKETAGTLIARIEECLSGTSSGESTANSRYSDIRTLLDNSDNSSARAVIEACITAENDFHADPVQAVELIIAAADMGALCIAWGDQMQRLANLDAMRNAARSYVDESVIRGDGCSIAGFVAYLEELDEGKGWSDDDEGVQGALPVVDAVTVLTYHKSKGLEWPVVILCDTLEKDEEKPFRDYFTVAVHTSGNQQFDLHSPFAGRRITYWPWPYSDQTKNCAFYDSFAATERYREMNRRRQGGEERLLYVGFTRAADLLVLAGGKAPKSDDNNDSKKSKKKSADDGDVQNIYRLNHIIRGFNAETIRTMEDGRIRLGDGLMVDGKISVFGPVERNDCAVRNPLPWFSGERADLRERYYINPSHEHAAVASLEISERNLGGRLPFQSRSEDADDGGFGTSLHGFFQSDDPSIPLAEREERARGHIQRFGGMADDAPHYCTAFDRIWSFAHTLETDGVVHRELPVRYHRDTRQVRGTADMVVFGDDAFHLIDYKTFAGNEHGRREAASRYAGQLALYAEGIQRATGLRCAGLWLYFAVTGSVVNVGYQDQGSSNGTYGGG